MGIDVIAILDINFPQQISVLYLDWELYNLVLVCIIGCMLSVSNFESQIQILLCFEKKNLDILLSRKPIGSD